MGSRNLKIPRPDCKFALHPLIHTFAPETSTQDLEKKKAEPKTPHFLSSNQDIVASPQNEKCGLKYVMFTQSRANRNATKKRSRSSAVLIEKRIVMCHFFRGLLPCSR
jgi:hypothetical protein